MKSGHKYEVLISERAQLKFIDVIEYLENNWPASVKEKFISNFKRVVILLEINPFIFQEYSKKKNIRKCLITKHNSLFYSVSKSKVQIITLYDTRQNPKKLII